MTGHSREATNALLVNCHCAVVRNDKSLAMVCFTAYISNITVATSLPGNVHELNVIFKHLLLVADSIF